MFYCQNPESDEPIMLINKHIGMDDADGMGIDGSVFQQELLLLDEMGKSRIQVWINSPGGVVMDGYNIYNAILKSKTKVDTYNVGIAASIAAVIFQAGRTRYMSDYSKLMYHNPFGGNDSKELEPMTDSIAIMVASRASKQKDEILGIMKKTTWISASEAFANGFCDEIEVSSNHNKKRLTKTSDAKAMWRESNLIVNSIFNQINTLDMKKVTNKLGLTEAANEDSILDAITNMENKAKLAAKNAEDALNDMEDKFKEAEKNFKETKDAYDKLKTEKELADKAKKDAEDKQEGEAVKNALEGYVKQGRIKKESVEKWTNTAAKIGIAEVKAMIEEIPLSKQAPKINIDATNEAKLTSVIAQSMADNREKLKL